MNKYLYQLNNTFYNGDLYDTLDKSLTDREKRIIQYKNYPFIYSGNHRYQGIKESQKFMGTMDSFIRSMLHFQRQRELLATSRTTVYGQITLSDDTLADIVSTRLKIDYYTYKNLTSFTSNWFW